MDLFTLFTLAVGLSMDAFAVSHLQRAFHGEAE